MNGIPAVYVVDDDPGALRSLSWLIEQAQLPVCQFRSGREFLESYCRQAPGCLVLDACMPGMSGLEVQKRLREEGSELPIIFVTAHGDVQACAQAFKAGAIDFLEKPVDGKILLDLIRKALRRGTERKGQEPTDEFAACMDLLTPHQRKVLEMLIAGRSLKEIAAVNNVTVQTVWKHRLAIYRKLGVENDIELVRLASSQERRP